VTLDQILKTPEKEIELVHSPPVDKRNDNIELQPKIGTLPSESSVADVSKKGRKSRATK
jgi:hypothetical protein